MCASYVYFVSYITQYKLLILKYDFQCQSLHFIYLVLNLLYLKTPVFTTVCAERHSLICGNFKHTTFKSKPRTLSYICRSAHCLSQELNKTSLFPCTLLDLESNVFVSHLSRLSCNVMRSPGPTSAHTRSSAASGHLGIRELPESSCTATNPILVTWYANLPSPTL